MIDKVIREHVKDAAEARSDLNILYGVIAILEGGTMSADCQANVQRIIGTCQREAQRCLRRYDLAIDRTIKAKQKQR